MKTFEEKVAIIASAFYNRFDEDGEPEILQKIFTSHDMSGPIALALSTGDIELKTDTPKEWLEDTYKVLDAVFEFPDNPIIQEEEATAATEEAPKKSSKKADNS